MESDRELAVHPGREGGEALLVVVEVLGAGVDHVLHDVEQVVAHLFGGDDLAAETVDDLALLVHHVVVFQRALADGEVLLLDAPLGGFDGPVQPAVLEHFAFLDAQLLHDAGDAVGAEQAHQVVFQRDEEARHARIALARAAPAQLAVDAPRLVALAADHVEPAGAFLDQVPQGFLALDLVGQLRLAHDHVAFHPDDAGAELDVGAAAGHVGGDGDGAGLAGVEDDFGFALVVLGVEHVVGHVHPPQHAAQNFRHVHGDRADEDGLLALVAGRDFLDDGVELLALGLVDVVVAVHAPHGAVGGDHDDVHLVDRLEFVGLGLGRAGHAGELLVEAEIVLDGDGGQGLGLALDAHAFLGLDGLVQAVAPAPAGHQAPGEFVDDDDLVVLDDVLHVALVDAEGADELVHGVDALALVGELVLEFLALRELLLVGQRGVAVEFGQGGDEVGHDVVVRIGRIHGVAALVGQAGVVALFVDHEIELLAQGAGLLLVHVDEHLALDFFEQAAGGRLFHQVQELLVLGHALADLVELQHRGFFVALFDGGLGLGHQARAQVALLADHAFHGGLHGLVLLGRVRRGAGNDQRRAGFVDQDRVHFVDDGVVPAALHHFLRAVGHAHVAQVVEAEFGVGAVGDVAGVLRAALVGAHLVLDAADRQAEIAVHGAHPGRVAARQVVVDRHDVHALARQRVQVGRQRRHQRLAFARGHFGDLAVVQHDAADELRVERHHVPGLRMPADVHDRPAQAAARVLDDGERLDHQVVKRFPFGEPRPEFVRLRLQRVLGQRLHLLFQRVDAPHERPHLFQVALVLRAQDRLQQPLHRKSRFGNRRVAP